MEPTIPAGQPIIDREKVLPISISQDDLPEPRLMNLQTAPFLIRTFVKVGTFHRLSQFQDGPLPVGDEQQVFTWKDATLLELLTTLRVTGPQTPEFRHPLARYSFRAVYADAANRGMYAQKDLGMVYSRDILGEPGTIESTAPRLLEDADGDQNIVSERQKEARTLDELRFVPGDYLCIAILLPKNVPLAVTSPVGELMIKGSGAVAIANGWKTAGTGGVGRGSLGPGAGPGVGRGGGGHWRGESNAPTSSVRGRGGRGDVGGRDRDLDRPRDDRDRRPPPPRRGDSPPPRSAGWGDRGDRGRGFKDRRSRSRSRSRSPPRRRR